MYTIVQKIQNTTVNKSLGKKVQSKEVEMTFFPVAGLGIVTVKSQKKSDFTLKSSFIYELRYKIKTNCNFTYYFSRKKLQSGSREDFYIYRREQNFIHPINKVLHKLH